MLSVYLIENTHAEYDHFVATHTHGHLFQSFAWGELKRWTGWHPLRLLIMENKQPVAGVSLLKLPYVGSHYLWYAPRGPVLDFAQEDLLHFLLTKLRQLAKVEQIAFLKIDPAVSASNKLLHATLLANKFVAAQNQILTGTLQYAQVYRINLPYQRPGHQQLIKESALHHRLSVDVKYNIDSLKIFYALLLEDTQLNHNKIRAYGYFEQMWQVFAPSDRRLFMVSRGQEVLGAALVITFGKTCYCLYNVIRHDAAQTWVSPYLHTNIMNWASSHGCNYYEIVDTARIPKKKPSNHTRPFLSDIEPYSYLGEYDLPYTKNSYRLWRLLAPVYRWSIS